MNVCIWNSKIVGPPRRRPGRTSPTIAMEPTMIINKQQFCVKGLNYMVRSAIDGETENLDREPGEGFIDIPDLNE
jgi:hypothetical protein